MKSKRNLLLCLLILSLLAGCSTAPAASSGSTSSAVSSIPISSTQTGAVQSGNLVDPATLFSARDSQVNYSESEAVTITLNGDSATASAQDGVSIDGSTITIGAEGIYILTGNLTNGQIIIDAPKTDKVQLVLKNATINCDTSAAIYVRQADKVFITLEAGSKNALSNTSDFVAIDENSIDAVLFSKEDLTLNGTGALTITAAYGHGVVSKDELVITGGDYTVTAAGHGFSGKDSIQILDGSFAITSGKDGFQSENNDDSTLGLLYIAAGDYTIQAGGDALSAAAQLQIDGGSFHLTAGTGSTGTLTADMSAKGIKSGGDLLIKDGSFVIDSTDDSIHTNGNLTLAGGDYTIASGDDGIHADSAANILAGTIRITKSYEGIEGATLLISGGDISLISRDDGLNAAGGNDGSSVAERPGRGSFSSSGGAITISGGRIVIDASGDGIDSNGTLTITGGETYVSGPTDRGNSALDCDGAATITGGILVAPGSSGMAQGFGSDSTQGWILYNVTTSQTGEIRLEGVDGAILSYTPPKAYNSVLLSAPAIRQGESYTLVMGGESATLQMDTLGYTNGGAGGMGGMGPGGNRGGGTPPADGTLPDGATPRGGGNRGTQAANPAQEVTGSTSASL